MLYLRCFFAAKASYTLEWCVSNSNPVAHQTHNPQSEVQNFQEECSRDLMVAEPVIAEAEAALNRWAREASLQQGGGVRAFIHTSPSLIRLQAYQLTPS
jgi:hypothetical protein